MNLDNESDSVHQQYYYYYYWDPTGLVKYYYLYTHFVGNIYNYVQ